MCGIAGFLTEVQNRERNRGVLSRMTSALIHRGPDGHGLWQDTSGQANLGHRRLAILDLTPTGNQPMVSHDGRYILTFNGEIYNFDVLRKELESKGIWFCGTSDTEVLLEAIALWGLEQTLPRLNGMFALGLWDAENRRLSLARDRLGEKPLYYGWHGRTLLFGSELKALVQHPDFRREVDRDVIPLFLNLNYIPYPHTIFKNTWKLPPGTFLTLGVGEPPAVPKPYWSLESLIHRSDPWDIDPNDPAFVDTLEANLKMAVKQRMVSDVPLGVLLSGGIDSSMVTALMQAQSSQAVKTFTIGLWDATHDEAKDAARVAKHLGTEHHELYLSSKDCTGIMARLPTIYDEPFADSSQIPTILVSEFTRRHVTVALSGDGGDEIFGGYNRYVWTMRIWPKIAPLSPRVRGIAANLLFSVTPEDWNKLFDALNMFVPKQLRVRRGGDKLHKLANALGATTPDQLYQSFIAQWQRPKDVLLPDHEWASTSPDRLAAPEKLKYVEKMMYLDTLEFLPSDILCKVDRASMSASLEVRAPFLDNELVELAWRLPLSSRIHSGRSKWPIRQVLRRYMPEQLFERPKAGFGIPLGEWLRGPLREWAEATLDANVLKKSGIFRPDVVRKHWSEHLSGRRDHNPKLWSILMFQSWLREQQSCSISEASTMARKECIAG
jgi:asparagine synthase (glutamine-hydrolysing)